MEKITLFANESCPYCQRVIATLKQHNKEYEFVEIPMDREERPATKYKDTTFGELFDNNISIPKMIIEQTKFTDSQDMIDHLDNE
jgi:glutaredoxin|tara:strand:+ start:78 stop:332 length:255 start_codon:yes stop_codon:yes gene_type:complete